jgi:DNA polymerase III subunit gamma/tau
VSYLVLARKWRPQTFEDLVGQEHIGRTLRNAIDSGRVAHAFLFTGARGVGKTSSARILAKALNCEKGPSPEPCNACPACEEITAGTSVDVLEIDGASNTGVDDIRELRETIRYLPSRSRYKIFIIDEVHMLSTNAFNALLKTLEEPPPHVKFIFATTEPHKLPITILSRCQRFDFRRISLTKIVERLRYIVDREEVAISDASLAVIARKGDGSMRDSLSTLDQVLAFSDREVSDEDVTALLGVVDRGLLLRASRSVIRRDPAEALEIVGAVDAIGYSMRQFCHELIDHFRDMVIVKVAGNPAELTDLSGHELDEVREEAVSVPTEDLQRHLSVLLKAENEIGYSSFPRLVLELALVKMATLPPSMPVDEILERLKELERTGGAPVVGGQTPRWESRPAPPREERASVPPPPASAPARTAQLAAAPPPPREAAPVPRGGGWEGFVAFVKEKKPPLGAFLQHVHPLEVGGKLDIGCPEGSFYLSRLKDPETLEMLRGFAMEYFGHGEVRIVAVAAEKEDLPPSVSENETLHREESSRKLREEAESHPLVSATLEIFGGRMEKVEPENGAE